MATRKPEGENVHYEGGDRSLAAAAGGMWTHNWRHLISNQHCTEYDIH